MWKRSQIATLCLGLALVLAVGYRAVASGSAPTDEERIDTLLEEIRTLDIASMPALPVTPYELPRAGVDVMRARVDEIYRIDGVGVDTVELRGWIAVMHDNPRLAEGEEDLEWGTAVIPTRFVGLDLRGSSEIFGDIRVTLDDTHPSDGEVGMVAPPAVAAGAGSSDDGEDAPTPEAKPCPEPLACSCNARVSVGVDMGDLGLEMRTEEPVLMQSRVTTIPPVGFNATVSLTPTELVSGDRSVGTLEHAKVKFREVVKHIDLQGTPR